MDTGLLAQKFGIGLATGLGIVGGIAAVFTPASFFMNRYLSHHWTLRALLGIASIYLFPIAWIMMALVWKKVHYTGMLPVIDAAGYSGWIATLIHPFLMTFNEGAYKRSIALVLGQPKGRYVSEPLVLGAAAAGAMSDQAAWTSAMMDLKELAATIRVASAEALGSEAVAETTEEDEAPPVILAPTTTTTTTVTPVATTNLAPEVNPEAGTGLAHFLKASNRKLDFGPTRILSDPSSGLNSSVGPNSSASSS